MCSPRSRRKGRLPISTALLSPIAPIRRTQGSLDSAQRRRKHWVILRQCSRAGVPVVYGYVADAHDNRGPALSGVPFASPEKTFGPGEAGYVKQLQAYDKAFGQFFARLAQDGITRQNTLFVVTADENDHFIGGSPSPANCDGVTIPCTYAKIGEINANLAGLLATEQGIMTPFKVHSDDAPTIDITGNPVRTDPVAPKFARATDRLTAVDP